MPDGAIIDVGGSGYLRYPRTGVKRLEQEGYQVWDLGPKDDYCAIIYDLWRKRSTDGGKTWQKREIHKQSPCVAKLRTCSLQIPAPVVCPAASPSALRISREETRHFVLGRDHAIYKIGSQRFA